MAIPTQYHLVNLKKLRRSVRPTDPPDPMTLLGIVNDIQENIQENTQEREVVVNKDETPCG